MNKLSNKTIDSTECVHEHIIEMRDMATQFKDRDLQINLGTFYYNFSSL